MTLATPTDVPISRLADCHQKIRAFLYGLDALVNLQDPQDPRAAPTAAMIARYLRVGLPLHAADEDEILGPVLLERWPEVEPLLQDLAAEHERIMAALPPLLEVLDRISAGQPAYTELLGPVSRAVAVPLRQHIEREETDLFPLVRRLEGPVADSLREAMRARRLNP